MFIHVFTSSCQGSASDKTNGLKLKKHSHKGFNSLYRAVSSVNPEDGITIEDIAATRIQNAFRRFKVSYIFIYSKLLFICYILLNSSSCLLMMISLYTFFSNILCSLLVEYLIFTMICDFSYRNSPAFTSPYICKHLRSRIHIWFLRWIWC